MVDQGYSVAARERNRKDLMSKDFRQIGSFTTLSPLNQSTSKQMFTFSKADRFMKRRLLNETVAYDARGTFYSNKSNASNKAFGQSSRFSYYPTPERQHAIMYIGHGKMPSPTQYEKTGFFSPRQTQNSFSFGVSRESMKKIYIQEIERAARDRLPGPDQYQLPRNFGAKGIHYSMRENTIRKEMNSIISKKGLMPGPGQYDKLDIVGTLKSTRLTSSIRTPVANAFSRAKDRFTVPTFKHHSPGPGKHSPKNNFTEHIGTSTHRHFGITVFGRDERRALDDRHKKFIDNPGPGHYTYVGEFGRYVVD